ncbi:hypothetical protein PanWU01x14_127350 [Parasponia andersonii]|uniref:Uncharacterized protein n=1 Tax=Parasponia andersonii TaxID=3476 RepID=A0A2P5CSD2_PARAD|nr:hypothetical protein PanWU01x14_127350 [Parasponia andersonii]
MALCLSYYHLLRLEFSTMNDAQNLDTTQLEEEKLAKKQADELKTHYKKRELIEGVISDGTAQRLGRRYKLRLDDR